MTQNIYDDDTFFAGYGQLDRSRLGLDGAPEWPTLRAMLPDLAGKRVLDLGCGFGWFCRWAAEQGAERVLGIDVSANMLARAQSMAKGESVVYLRADLEAVTLPRGAFDLVYSSLALHYIVDLEGLLAKVRRALKPGGVLVCSVEHPTMTAPTEPEWVKRPDGRSVWPLDRYLAEGERVTDWLAPGVIKQHRTIETYVALLLGAGFRLTDLREWGPSLEQIAERPDFALGRERPFFMLLGGRLEA